MSSAVSPPGNTVYTPFNHTVTSGFKGGNGMKKVLSMIIVSLLAVLCFLTCAALAEAGGGMDLRMSPVWEGYCTFSVRRSEFTDLFWGSVLEENPYSRASLNEADWIEMADQQKSSVPNDIIPKGYRLYQKIMYLQDGQEAVIFTAFTDEEDFITSLTCSVPDPSTLRSWASDDDSVAALTINYYILNPGACFAALTGQALPVCEEKINRLISNAADGVLPGNDHGEYYVTEGNIRYSISFSETHIPHFRFCTVPEMPESMPEPAPEPTAEPATESTVEPAPELTPEPTAEPAEEPTMEPAAGPTPELTPEPTAEPTPELTPEPTAEPAAEPTAGPEPVPTPEIILIAYTNKPANVRDVPDKNGKQIGRIQGRNIITWILEVIEGSDGKTWYKVLLKDGTVGYARSDFFHNVKPYEEDGQP